MGRVRYYPSDIYLAIITIVAVIGLLISGVPAIKIRYYDVAAIFLGSIVAIIWMAARLYYLINHQGDPLPFGRVRPKPEGFVAEKGDIFQNGEMLLRFRAENGGYFYVHAPESVFRDITPPSEERRREDAESRFVIKEVGGIPVPRDGIPSSPEKSECPLPGRMPWARRRSETAEPEAMEDQQSPPPEVCDAVLEDDDQDRAT